MKILLVMAAFYAFGSALPAPQFFFPQGNRQRPQRPFFRPGGPLGLGILVPHEQRPGQQPATPAVPATAAAVPSPVADPPPPIPSTPVVNPTGEVVPAAGAVPVNPGSLFTDGQGANNNNQLAGLLGMLNGGQLGSATAGGAGNGAVQDGKAVGQGTGIANVGPGGFGIGLGIGGAIATPLGNLAFGQGDSIAVGK